MPDASRFRPVLRLLGWVAVPIAALGLPSDPAAVAALPERKS